jgi:hypothetical protein
MEHKTLPQRVKEVTDFVYEYLAQQNDFVQLNARGTLGSHGAAILSNLIKRGIVEKKTVPNNGKRGHACAYKWVATMAPTKTLYGSITDQLRDEKKNRKKPKKSTSPAVNVVGMETITLPDYHLELSAIPDQELWDELKRRGYFIVNNQLAISRLEYLN